MAGGILQLVINRGAPQNLWLDHNPQITFFKRVYRRHTPFASELVPLSFKTKLDFGGTSKVVLTPIGDLIYRTYLSFEIPELSAAFLHTKTADIATMLNSVSITDNNFKNKIQSYILNNTHIEYDNILKLIDIKIEDYQKEEDHLLNILETIDKTYDPNGIDGLININEYLNGEINDLENDFYLPKINNIAHNNNNNFQKYKIHLGDIFINEFKDLLPMYELIKLIYLSEKKNIELLPLTNTFDLINHILYNHIFHDLIPNREILLSHIIKNYKQSTNINSRISDVNNFLMKNADYVDKYHDIYHENHIIHTNTPLQTLDNYKLVLNEAKLNNIFYDYGPSYYQILNSYHTIINVLNTLACTTPTVLIKPFTLKNTYNIYQDKNSSMLTKTYFPTIIDPNFRADLMARVNANETSNKMIDTNFLPINILKQNEPIYSNQYHNEYLDFFNSQSNTMFINIKSSIDTLFEKYRDKLFTSTDKLFFNNSTSLSNIYGYFVPEQDRRDDLNNHITNVFNANIWYLYFFKYLDMLDESEFTNHVKYNIFPTMSFSSEKIMKNLIILLKINLEYYMYENSYLMNDLYATSPSVNPNDTMKNYIPLTNNKSNNILSITLIFHRNQIPSILEIFQFIYYFIDQIDIERINKYLNLQLIDVEPKEMNRIRDLSKLLYYSIFKHFMDVYDSFHFEASANFSTDQFNHSDNISIQQFVSNFLKGNDKTSISQTLPQMEFYFVAEMINLRQTQKFYYNILSNHQLISEKVGSSTAQILKIVHNTLVKINNRSVPKNDIQLVDNVRRYWDDNYRYNIDINENDKLYYSTFNIDRYSGESYLNTSYQSRDNNVVPPNNEILPLLLPDPLPPSNPYGINPNYYSHIINTNITITLSTSNINRVNTLDNNDDFKLYDIDYYRIRHDVFSRPIFNAEQAKSIDLLQMNLLAFLKLSEYLVEIYPNYDKWLLDKLVFIVEFLLKNILLDLEFLNENVSQILNMFYIQLINSIDENKLIFSQAFLKKIHNIAIYLLEQYFLNNPIGIYQQSKPYTASDLLDNNLYTQEILKNSNLIMHKIDVIKNNFLSQYYYYSLNSKNIDRISQISKNFIFDDIGQILEELIDIPKNSSLAYIYPDLHSNTLSEIIDNQQKLSDFDKYLFNSITTILQINRPGKTTIKDIFNMLNMTFWATSEINNYLLKNNLTLIIKQKLVKYQSKMLKKILLYNEINNYLDNLPKNKFLEENDIIYLSNCTVKYKIEYSIFYQYLVKFAVEYNNATLNLNINYRDLVLINRFRSTLDPFILGNYDFDNSFKKQIINDIFKDGFGDQHPLLKNYFNYIDNEYYAYIYFYINYAEKNKLISIKNPLMFYDENTLINNWDEIDKYYHSFNYVSDFFNYLIDYFIDYTILNNNQLDYDKKFSIMANDIYLSTEQFNTKTDHIQDIINALEKVDNPSLIDKLINKDTSAFFVKLDKKTQIKVLGQDIIQKRIILINKMKQEISIIKNKLETIMYRNKRAKTAWIRKLGHFLVKEVTITAGNVIIDKHISNWLEIYHQISKKASAEDGYLKMIGHRQDLIIFNDSIKKSYQIIIPFIFYFNKYLQTVLPLNASAHTEYEITVQLRDLADVTYKEEFSDFVNSNMELVKPAISKANLMVEYIYLAEDERKIFATSSLEYLIDELQYDDTVTINDTNLEPIYHVAGSKRVKTILQNGEKRKIETYNPNQILEVSKNDLDKNIFGVDLLPRNDYYMEKHINRSGIEQLMMMYKPLSVDPNVHKKRINIENHYQNPTKMMAVVFRPLSHTDTFFRTNDNSYFYDEKQWDNYGLYSYYNLDKINYIKKMHLLEMTNRINNLEDPIFGFIAIINQLLLQYPVKSRNEYLDKSIISNNDKWIETHYIYFQETLQTIKDAYNNYHEEIINGEKQIRLKENILSLQIDYPINNPKILERMITEILIELNIEIETSQSFTSINNRQDLIDIVTNLLSNYIENATINQNDINQVVNEIYDDYNESQINMLVFNIDKLLNLENMSYHIKKIVYYSYQIYLSYPSADDNILEMLEIIHDKLEEKNIEEIEWMNNGLINYLICKDVIGQILQVNNLIVPYRVLNVVCSKISEKINEIIDKYPVDLIDYNKYLIENPKVNPLVSGYLKFNDTAIMAENSKGIMWSESQGYQYFLATPDNGVNLHSWSLNPLTNHPSGAINLSRIDKFDSVYNVHPIISNTYPVNVITMVLSLNMMRFLSGMCGKTWISTN